jgi:hypothetical protein
VQLTQCYSLIPCLFFSYGVILPVLSWFCLLLFSVCRIPWRIFCSGGLVVICSFTLCLSMEDKVLESQSSGYLLLYPSCHLHFLSFEKSEKRRMEQFLPGESVGR